MGDLLKVESQDVIIDFPWRKLVLQSDPCFCQPDYETALFTRIAEYLKPGMVCVDVGAHQGIWSSFMASKIGPRGFVYAFEPSAINYVYLAINTAPRLGDAPVACLPIALGSKDEQKQLRCWMHQPAKFGSTGMHQLIEGDQPEYTVTVPVRRLDSLFASDVRIDFIKIDVEHWELEVLQGMAGLRGRLPRLLVEIHSEANKLAILEWCFTHNCSHEILTALFPALPDHVSEYVYIQPEK